MSKWKKFMGVLLAGIMTCMTFSGCGGSADTAAKDEKSADAAQQETKEAGGDDTYTIALIPQLIGNTYFETSNEWAQRAGEDLGVEVIYTGASTSDPASQSNIVSDMITKGVDCICIAAVDPDALSPVLKKARDAGIKVITWDSDVNDKDARDLYVTYCIDQQLGEHLGEELAKYMEGEGQYAIITSLLTVQNNAAWSKYATEYIEKNYPDMERIAYEPCEDDQSKAYSITQNLMTAYPELKGILGVTTPAPPAAAQAVEEAGKSGDIKVVGIVEPSTSREYLKNGAMQEAIIWHPGKLGYLTIAAAKSLLDGETFTDGQEVDQVGKVIVEEDKVIMDEILDITAETVDDYDF
ncbi:MAG: autoinducer 2 ABC transporter substrate-binding protein [Blautia sp.]|jgi:rhamnose transport system substrate-binding protein